MTTSTENDEGLHKYLSEQAEKYDSKRCFICHEPMYYAEDNHAYGPGHIYSIDGRNEARISGTCEHCFDRVFQEPEEEPDYLDGDKKCDKCGAGMHFDLTYTETQSAYVCGNPECDHVVYGSGGF